MIQVSGLISVESSVYYIIVIYPEHITISKSFFIVNFLSDISHYIPNNFSDIFYYDFIFLKAVFSKFREVKMLKETCLSQIIRIYVYLKELLSLLSPLFSCKLHIHVSISSQTPFQFVFLMELSVLLRTISAH